MLFSAVSYHSLVDTLHAARQLDKFRTAVQKWTQRDKTPEGLHSSYSAFPRCSYEMLVLSGATVISPSPVSAAIDNTSAFCELQMIHVHRKKLGI